MKVTAIKRGFFDGEYRREGDKFECSEAEFSSVWMVEGEAEIKPIDNSKVKKGEDVVHKSLEIPSLMNKEKAVEPKEEKKAEVKEKPKKAKKKATKKAD